MSATILSNGQNLPYLVPTGEATALLLDHANEKKSATVIATQKIRDGFDEKCLEQARNTM